ncbi:MAG: hypothetical protein R2849_12795 [Thermomicrobiales bacterium]
MTFELYRYAGNEASNAQGETIDDPAFAVQSAPTLTDIAEDPTAPEVPFQIATEGHFVIVARASWGSHPTLNREVFVTWVFDVVVGGNSPSSATPATVQAVQKVRDFLDDQTAELVVDRVQESAGLVFVNLSRSAPAMEDQPQYANQFFVEVAENSIFAADLNSNTLPVQPWHSVDKREARAIAEDFFEQKNVDFGEFTLVSSETLQLNDYLLNVTWAIEDDGVWLPTTVEVGVSLQTGLAVRYIDRDYPYDGPRG